MSLAYLLGSIFLLHAGYSSYEHHQLFKHTSASVPVDVILELLVGLVIINFGAIDSITNKSKLGVTHAGVVEPLLTFLRPILMTKATKSINDLGISEFEELDTRVDFLDVVAKRKEYSQWAEKP